MVFVCAIPGIQSQKHLYLKHKVKPIIYVIIISCCHLKCNPPANVVI